MTAPTADEARLRRQLDEVAAWEASIRPGAFTWFMRRLGRTRGFAAVYRNVGPKLDPHLARINDGKLFASILGLPEMMLHTTGAKTGQARVSPVLFLRDGDDFLVLGTNFGQAKHPGWTANLIAHPEAAVEVGPATIAVTAEPVTGEDFDRHYTRFVEVYPGYADYRERRKDLPPRMFRLVPHA